MCEPGLCPDAPEGGRCADCPLDKLDAAESSGAGMLIRRAMDLRAALNLGIDIPLDQIPADEFYAMLLLEEAREHLDREQGANGK